MGTTTLNGTEKKPSISYWAKEKVICPVCNKGFQQEVMQRGGGRMIAGPLTDELHRIYEPSKRYGRVFPMIYEIGCCPSKWNSYDNCYNEDRRIEFLTAWSPPHEIMEELARRFPEAGFLHRWADEDIGSNVGQREYEHGECVEIYEPSDQKECIDLACEVWGDDPLDLGFMLNRSGTGYCQVDWEEYDVIELLDRRMLFTDCRLSPDDIPVGLYAYDLRHTDDGARFGSIEPRVIVNHGGTVLTDQPIDFGDKGFIELTEDTDPNFLGYKGTMGQLLRDELDLPESDLRTGDEPNQTEGMTLA